MKKVLAVMAVLALLCLGSLAHAAITIATVPMGDAGNRADTTGYGSVGYNYNVGKYEVTAGQYTAFLNVVAVTDTYSLYNAAMSRTDYGSGITRNGTSGSYTYSVASDFINRPVNYVSWGDCARFANWLDNGQPTGPQGPSTTEDGAYYLSGATADTALGAITRKAGCKWAICSENEWYKAAYYKGGGTSAGYWVYPTSSDRSPGQDMADPHGNNANYYTAPYSYPIDSGKYTTVVGQFQNSAGPYGTSDQGGNVWEWNESIAGGAYCGVRGGSFDYSGTGAALVAASRNYSRPSIEHDSLGFRVAEVPEPSGFIALGSGILALCGTLRRPKRQGSPHPTLSQGRVVREQRLEERGTAEGCPPEADGDVR